MLRADTFLREALSIEQKRRGNSKKLQVEGKKENDEIRKWKGLRHERLRNVAEVYSREPVFVVTCDRQLKRPGFFLYGSFSGLVRFRLFFALSLLLYTASHFNKVSSSFDCCYLFQTNDLLRPLKNRTVGKQLTDNTCVR